MLSVKTSADTRASFYDLTPREQIDFREELRKTYVLGERPDEPKGMSGSGVLFVQHLEIQKLDELIDAAVLTQDPKLLKLIEQEALAAFNLDQAVIDWTYEYRLKISGDEKQLAALYSQITDRFHLKDYDEIIIHLREETDRKLLQIQSAFSKPFQARQSDPQIKNDISQIIERTQKKSWSPDWERSWNATIDLATPMMGIFWVEYKFAEEWTGFKLKSHAAPGSIQPDEASRIQREIDDFVEEKFATNDRLHFKAALQQVLHSEWATSDTRNFAYYRLNNDDRNLFAARLFPDLNLKLARSLIELRFFEITEEERFTISQQIYLTPDDLLKFSTRYFQIGKSGLKDPHEIQNFHEILVSDYLLSRTPKPPDLDALLKRELLNGDKVLDVEKQQEKKRRMLLEEYKEPTFINLVSDWWKIHFDPYDGYWSEEQKRFCGGFWSEEQKRFKDEWQRRRETKDLEKRFRSAKNATERDQITQEIIASFSRPPVDGSSPSVYLSSFLFGAIPHEPKDAFHILKVAATGYTFYVVTRFIGGKMALSILGVVGILGIKDILETSDQIFYGSTTESRVDATEQGGRLIQDFASFGIGSALGHLSIDFSRISRMRKIESYQEQIKKFNQLIERNKSKVKGLSDSLKELTERREKIEKLFGKDSKAFLSTTLEISKTEHQISQLKNGTLASYEGRLEFYSKRIVIEAARMAMMFGSFVSLPLRSGLAEKTIRSKSFRERFQRDAYLGEAQYKQVIEKLSSLIEKRQKMAVPSEAVSRISAVFQKSFANFLKSQKRTADYLITAEEGFDSVRARFLENNSVDEPSELESFGRKNLKDITSATRALEKAMNEFGEHSREAKDFSTLTDGALKDLAELKETDSSSPNLSKTQRVLMAAEKIRQRLIKGSEEKMADFPWEESGDINTKRFFAESYLRLSRQLEVLENLTKAIGEDFTSGRLPADALLIEKLNRITQMREANRIAIESLWPEFNAYIDNSIN
ncbi:MAG: hypothetical protein JWQ35_1725 [Bacteriovoracaceae bacterium]|nr:hypothetical protein [Bacteriovoracaceae bacterium]